MTFRTHPETINRLGKPKGTKGKRTIELEFAQKQLQQMVFQNLKPLAIAGIIAAKGEQYIYRVDKDENGKESHVMLTDGKEIGEALDAIASNSFEDKYFYINTKPSNTASLKELFDRGFGKSRESVEVKHTGNITHSLASLATKALEMKQEKAIEIIQDKKELPYG